MWMQLVTFDAFSFFGGEFEAPVDTRIGTSLNVPAEARRIESPGQPVLPPKAVKP
jgi:hypothetical protein